MAKNNVLALSVTVGQPVIVNEITINLNTNYESIPWNKSSKSLFIAICDNKKNTKIAPPK